MSDTLQHFVVDCAFSHSAAHSITTTTIHFISSQKINLQYSEEAHFLQSNKVHEQHKV